MNTNYQSQFEFRLSQLLKLPIWVFGISFTIGTLILLLHLFGNRDISYAIGFLFILLAVFVNASLFGALVICSFLFKEYQKTILQQAAILLINIPVAVVYLYIVINNPFTTSSHYQF